MILETERLILRMYSMDDFNALKEIISDPETMKYYEKPYDDKGVTRWIQWNLDNYETFGFGLWAIELKENRRMIGDCGVTIQNIDHRFCPEIGYHIHKDYWRKGYATEACRAVKKYIFENTPFQTVYSYMNAENTASWKTAEKNGMKFIKAYTENNVAHKVYAITRAEYEAEAHD